MNRIQNIFLMRHGSSARNEKIAEYGDVPDHVIPLTDSGARQAAEAGVELAAIFARLDIRNARAWNSPYERARQTAMLALAGMGSDGWRIRDSRENIFLIERDYGLFDGLSSGESAELWPEEYRRFRRYAEYKGNFFARPLNGESDWDVCARVSRFLDTAHRDAQKSENPVPDILVVSHGVTIKALVMMLLHKSIEWFEAEPNPENCSVRHIMRGKSGYLEDAGYAFDGFGMQK
jgi:broad specificity phosphatase PhoE